MLTFLQSTVKKMAEQSSDGMPGAEPIASLTKNIDHSNLSSFALQVCLMFTITYEACASYHANFNHTVSGTAASL